MQRRQFLLATAAAVSSLPAKPYTSFLGDVLMFSGPRAVRFHRNTIAIENRGYGKYPISTWIGFSDDAWRVIIHKNWGYSLYYPAPITLPDATQLDVSLRENLTFLTRAMIIAKSENPAWWSERPLFQQALKPWSLDFAPTGL